MERPGLGRALSLGEIQQLGLQVDLMVTGTGAINHSGIRFGKRHGFFDLEWGMLTTIKAVSFSVPCIAVVHDCQLLEKELRPEIFDTVCDCIVTPTTIVDIAKVSVVPKKPSCGILWDKLQPGMREDIPPLEELRRIQPRD